MKYPTSTDSWGSRPSDNQYSRSSLIRFHVCEFAYLLKFICNPQINNVRDFEVICRDMQNGKAGVTFLAAVRCSDVLPPCFSFQIIHKHRFYSLFGAMLLHFCAFVGDFFCFKWPLNVVPKCCLAFLSARR